MTRYFCKSKKNPRPYQIRSYEIHEGDPVKPYKLIQRREKLGHYAYMGSELCGLPLVINFDPHTTTRKQLYQLVQSPASPLLTPIPGLEETPVHDEKRNW